MAVLAVMAGLVDARLEAVKLELLGVFRDQLDSMLVEISRDYKIDLEELQEKYEIFSDPKTPAAPVAPVAAKAPAKAKARKAKSDSDGEERKKCEAKTAKGAACKNFALAGGCLCACHSKGKSKPSTLRAKASKGGVKPVDPPSSDSESEEKPKAKRVVKRVVKKVEIESDSESETEASVKSPVKAYKRPGKKVPVVHTHGMDDEVHDECEACDVIGNVMADSLADAEKVVVPPEVMKELDALFESDDEDESGDEGEEASLDEIDE